VDDQTHLAICYFSGILVQSFFVFNCSKTSQNWLTNKTAVVFVTDTFLSGFPGRNQYHYPFVIRWQLASRQQ